MKRRECGEPGCSTKHFSGGRCQRHDAARRYANTPKMDDGWMMSNSGWYSELPTIRPEPDQGDRQRYLDACSIFDDDGGFWISRRDVAERSGWECARCGYLIVEAELSIDRILPGSKGGTYVASNVQAAHSRCNRQRGNRPAILSWRASLLGQPK